MNGPFKEEKPETLYVSLMQGIHRLGQMGRKMSFLPLSKGEFLILCLLSRMSQTGEMVYVSHLASRMRVSPPAISRLLRRLEEKGFISRAPGTKDRRNTTVCLTGEGRAAFTQSEEQLRCFVKDLISDFTEEKTTQLVRLMNELSQLAEERIGDGE